MARKFYRTVVSIEILSEDEPYGDGRTLEDIGYAITEGHCSGKITTASEAEVTAPEMAKLLVAQGSDPEFFQLDENGNEVDDS